MKYVLPLIALLIATPASAKDITITLNDNEQKVFLAILDAALKAGGLASMDAIAQFVVKYRDALKPATEAPKAK
jgi:hypothetical protein